MIWTTLSRIEFVFGFNFGAIIQILKILLIESHQMAKNFSDFAFVLWKQSLKALMDWIYSMQELFERLISRLSTLFSVFTRLYEL